MGVQIPHRKGAILGERKAHCEHRYRDFLPWAVQERPNWSICHLDWGLEWAERNKCSIVFARLRQCAYMGTHNGASWWIRLSRPSTAAMRSYDILVWLLVLFYVLFHLAFYDNISLYYFCHFATLETNLCHIYNIYISVFILYILFSIRQHIRPHEVYHTFM